MKVIRELQSELLRKTVTATDLQYLKDQIRAVEIDREQVAEKAKKDLEVVSKIEELATLPAKMREIELESLKRENTISELRNSLDEQANRIKILESANTRAD